MTTDLGPVRATRKKKNTLVNLYNYLHKTSNTFEWIGSRVGIINVWTKNGNNGVKKSRPGT